MRELTYGAMLVFVLVATLPLEVLLGIRVYARARRLALVILCAGLPFAVWDVAATHAGHWRFDTTQTLGVVLPGGLPLEEWMFFVVVPLASVMTLEAVRAVRGWPVGDEPGQPDRPTPEEGR
jgi:lycopene cyclase domain-containing protein